MPDASAQEDAEIINAAYAERVKDLFKALSESLAIGENEKSCQERFTRSLHLVGKARNLALQAMSGEVLVEPGAPQSKFGAASEEIAAEPLSAEDQALVDQVLAGTTGVAAPPPVQRFRSR